MCTPKQIKLNDVAHLILMVLLPVTAHVLCGMYWTGNIPHPPINPPYECDTPGYPILATTVNSTYVCCLTSIFIIPEADCIAANPASTTEITHLQIACLALTALAVLSSLIYFILLVVHMLRECSAGSWKLVPSMCFAGDFIYFLISVSVMSRQWERQS